MDYTFKRRITDRMAAWFIAGIFPAIVVFKLVPGKWPKIAGLAVFGIPSLPLGICLGVTVGPVIECTYSMMESKMNAILIVLMIVFAAMPPVLSYYESTKLTIGLSAVFTSALALLSVYVGYQQAVDKAKREVNQRWLPQARSACNRLLTVCCSVSSLKGKLETSCKSVETRCPPLQETKNAAAKMFIENQCNFSANALEGIAHHLEDAYKDWHNFIASNCEKNECEGIFKELDDRKKELAASLGSCGGGTT